MISLTSRGKKRIAATDKAKIHLARALIVNPQIMAVQKPLIHFNADEQDAMLQVFREHVDNRGLGQPVETVAKRRPRTVFLSVENDRHADEADIVLEMKLQGSTAGVSVKKSKTQGLKRLISGQPTAPQFERRM